MRITSASFNHNQPIPDEFAFCVPDPNTHATFGRNRNPQLSWTGVPVEAKSLVLICVDPDVPSVGDDVNKEGHSVSESLPRCDFYHWVMIDIPVSCKGVAAGECSDGVTPHGKQNPPGPDGSIQGVTNYTDWFAGDKDMGGTYRGYDGPAPPWNDERLHHYHFKLFALDVANLDVKEGFRGPDVLTAMKGHILAQTEVVGTYTLNPKMR